MPDRGRVEGAGEPVGQVRRAGARLGRWWARWGVARGGAVALVAASGLVGCASAALVGGGGDRVVRFTNTTVSCGRPFAVEVEVDGATVAVEPGASVLWGVPAGGTVARIVKTGRPDVLLEAQPWRAEAGEVAARHYGCAAAEVLAPGPGRVWVDVARPAWGCAPGRQGPVEVSADGEALGVLAPGERVRRALRVGPVSLRVRADGGDEVRSAVVGADGDAIALGCPARAVGGGELAVLAVVGPSAECPRGSRVAVAVAGTVAELGPGEAWTAVLGPGRHRIVLREGDGPEVEAWHDLGAGATVLRVGACLP